MRVVLKIAALSVPLVLSGCGWLTGDHGYFRDRSDDYRKARSIPPMQVPEGKSKEAIQPLYGIPVEKTDALLAKEFEVPRPAALLGNQDESVVRIQKLGDEQWILLDGAPGEIWPRIRAFLISNHIGLEREDAATGQMETSWLGFKSDESKREKYRFRVEQGVQRNSTEVYVLQMGYEKKEDEEVAVPTEWGKASMDPERESWMVRQLASYLADASDDSSVSLLAQGIGTVNKVYLVRDESGKAVIDLRLPFERAWASLGRALERAEFNVQDMDRSAGVYYVKYEPGKSDEDEEDKKGFFSRLFGWWGDDDDNNPAEGKVYRVEMREGPEGVLIGVRRDDGKEFEDGEVEFVLGLIRTHLA